MFNMFKKIKKLYSKRFKNSKYSIKKTWTSIKRTWLFENIYNYNPIYNYYLYYSSRDLLLFLIKETYKYNKEIYKY